MSSYSRELEAALEAVREASLVCRRVQRELAGAALQKEDKSPVTVADFASQAIVCRVLAERCSGDPIIGEETASDLLSEERRPFLDQVVSQLQEVAPGATREAVCGWIDAGLGESAGRFWTLDPIDGTKGFLRGEQYAVSLALIVDGQIQVSVLGCPNLSVEAGGSAAGAVFSAVRGEGAWVRALDDMSAPARGVKVSDVSEASAIRICESVESGHSAHGRSATIASLLGTTAPAVRLDSQAKYAVVARGEADVYLRLPTRPGYREKIWDHAGGVLVVEEAGGRVTDIEGRALEFIHGRELTANRGVVVTNGRLHAAVLDAVARTAEST
ncbi:MAG: 3'(2'),5'-bisphosphate nucleotidase [Planctomyces sp.]|nr:3'(2'),5'-bisphosphate nucleotidase [Planctomyces sp.]